MDARVIEYEGAEYGVIDGDQFPAPVVFDADMLVHVKPYKWYFDTNVYYSAHRTLQDLVWAVKGNVAIPQGKKLVHINGFKTDNRISNLALVDKEDVASCSERRGRAMPPAEVLTVVQAVDKVSKLPRFMRWETSDARFVIEDHPALRRKVSEGLLKKARWVGSKSSKLVVRDKYLAAKDQLRQLDAACSPVDPTVAAHLGDELVAIARVVRGESFVDPRAQGLDQAFASVPKGRKKPCTLPAGSGITAAMLPAGTYYRPANDTHGDKFTIDVTVDGAAYQWSTTSKRDVSTADKYQQLMQHIGTLPDGARAKLVVADVRV